LSRSSATTSTNGPRNPKSIPFRRQRKGIYFYTPEGKRFIDFNSQLMSVNRTGDPRVIQAISDQAPLAMQSFMEPAGALRKLVRNLSGDMILSSSQNGGAKPTRRPSSSSLSLPDAKDYRRYRPIRAR